ncbi:molybdopterin-binding protein [bacterium]|nr:MAG: molybdopterin-binding protein [bacterium]
MCDTISKRKNNNNGTRTVSVKDAVGMVIPHDITEIRPGEFKGRAFKKGHIVREEDISYLQKLGKENLFVLEIKDDEIHENDAAYALAKALAGPGVRAEGEPNEGKINLVASRDGLLKVNQESLLAFNMLGEVMCATVHNNSVVKKGQTVAGTRAIPLVVKKFIVDNAVAIAENSRGILSVHNMKRPRAGIVITGNEVFSGKIEDAFEAVITGKIEDLGGEITGVYFAPDKADYNEEKIRELVAAGADLIITTGGMSVDPDDVTRFAIRNLSSEDITYGSPVLPGAMFLVAYIDTENSKLKHIPVLGIPACGMYSNITVFDMVLPRILAGEIIGRKELAELGHGGLCLKCDKCRYPVCPFGK